MLMWGVGIEAAMSSYGMLGSYQYFSRENFVEEFEAWTYEMIPGERIEICPHEGARQRQLCLAMVFWQLLVF